eukprot:CAMPEP_0194773304 /NCGR_PEP_ID=MMETSP0323_2-20130528/54445_1 /TAXON_ID=2866 ORGANISM="Crypthecodinium cohnii, Strain Seligo" /NCGR_SAMPLE_ID=MMETSP0323_2 /ASSEMBLY_ACC=CAM_ASM_000346 /LENGTH=178 /DNA_ID=CAMNT_0039708269 /DNA_START=252 /DNA_END=789 /DNA_ORIENTATION=-
MSFLVVFLLLSLFSFFTAVLAIVHGGGIHHLADEDLCATEGPPGGEDVCSLLQVAPLQAESASESPMEEASKDPQWDFRGRSSAAVFLLTLLLLALPQGRAFHKELFDDVWIHFEPSAPLSELSNRSLTPGWSLLRFGTATGLLLEAAAAGTGGAGKEESKTSMSQLGGFGSNPVTCK